MTSALSSSLLQRAHFNLNFRLSSMISVGSNKLYTRRRHQGSFHDSCRTRWTHLLYLTLDTLTFALWVIKLLSFFDFFHFLLFTFDIWFIGEREKTQVEWIHSSREHEKYFWWKYSNVKRISSLFIIEMSEEQEIAKKLNTINECGRMKEKAKKLWNFYSTRIKGWSDEAYEFEKAISWKHARYL